MSDKRHVIKVTGVLAALTVTACMAVQLNGQQATASGDFTNAATAEVLDAQGQVVLRGQFAPADEDDGDTERRATLEPTGVDTDAAGEAEVEFSKVPAKQEVEFSVRNLQAGGVFTFVIDGNTVATATADRRGRAEVELDVPMPGTSASR